MKTNIIYLIFTVILLSLPTQAQERDSLIQLYEGLGDTIYSFEREYFNLFQQIEGFEYAVFYIQNDNKLVSKITIRTDDEVKDTTSIHNITVLEKVRSQINKIDAENSERRNSPKNVIVYTEDENHYTGLLEMFSKENLYLLSNEQDHYRYKIPLFNVEKIIIPAESKVLSPMELGALIGVVVGGFIGIVSGDDEEGLLRFTAGEKALVGGSVLGLLGALIGLFVGLGTSEDEQQQIQFNDESDIIKLKGIAYYYFFYNKSLEDKYDNIN